MPTYACDRCGKAFRSKAALQEHMDSHSAPTESALENVPDVRKYLQWRTIRGMFTLRNAGIMFGVLMMSTLFLGTAMFMQSTTPNTQGPTGNVAGAETEPPTGYSITSESDLPRLSGNQQPSTIANTQLSTDQQLWVLTQGGQNGNPGVLLQYNCPEGCPDLVSNLEQVAQNYNGWVYVAPYNDMDERIALTAFQNVDRPATFDRNRINQFVCSSLRNQPLACAVGGMNQPSQGQETQEQDDGNGNASADEQ